MNYLFGPSEGEQPIKNLRLNNLNGVWRFRGYWPKGCRQVPECHHKRKYFKLDMRKNYKGYDQYLMGVIPSKKCKD